MLEWRKKPKQFDTEGNKVTMIAEHDTNLFNSPDGGYPAIVSVVTRTLSDDCNGAQMSGAVYLQIIRKGNTFALHFSKDKVNWKLSRIFEMDMPAKVKVGISAQCPCGEQCLVTFEDFEIKANDYQEIRVPK